VSDPVRSDLAAATARMLARLQVAGGGDASVGLHLRAVRDSDGPALTRIVGDAYDEFACGPLDPTGFDADLAAPARFAHERGRHWWTVTAGEDAPVASVAHSALHHGAASAREDVLSVELHRLYLAPQVRGRGLAGLLIGGVAEEARLLGAELLVAWSDTRLVAAHARYLALGFTLADASRELGDPAGTTEVRFEFPLQA